MNTVIVGFGSNIDPDINIPRAKEMIARDHAIRKESTFVTTKPVGYTKQNDFVNGAVLIGTEMGIGELKIYLRNIEIQLGRTKDCIKGGPRTIDLDILAWNGKIIDQDFYTRDFLKNSVLELAPDIKH